MGVDHPARGDRSCAIVMLIGVGFLALAAFTTSHQVAFYGHLFGVWCILGLYAIFMAAANFWFTARSAISYSDRSFSFVRKSHRLEILSGELVSIRMLIFFDVGRTLPMIIKTRRGSVLYKLPDRGADELFRLLSRANPDAHVTNPLPKSARGPHATSGGVGPA